MAPKGQGRLLKLSGKRTEEKRATRLLPKEALSFISQEVSV